jgi:uncharacterized membrane protein
MSSAGLHGPHDRRRIRPADTRVDGQYALRRLDDASSIALYASALIDKSADGELKVRQQSGDAGIATLSGSAIGAIIGLLGGPVGVALGAGAGGLLGRLSELDAARIDADFLDDVSSVLTPGRSAVVAEIDEDWTAPVDDAVEALGGWSFGARSPTLPRHRRSAASMR